MQRIRKQKGTAQIKLVIEKECPVEEIEKTLEDIRVEIHDGFEILAVNISKFDEVRIDTHGEMSAKKKYKAKESEKE